MAPVIYTSKEKGFDINKVIEEVKKAITDSVAVSSNNENVVETELKISVHGHGMRPFGKNDPQDYIDLSIAFGRTEWQGLGSSDIRKIGNALETWAKGLGADVELTTLNYTFDPFHSDGEFPSHIRFFTEGCKEFKQLRDLVMADGIDLKLRTLYNVRLFGKRGEYGESGKRDYIAYNPNECKRLIAIAKKSNVVVKTLDDIDLEDSIRYETECYGYRKVTLCKA